MQRLLVLGGRERKMSRYEEIRRLRLIGVAVASFGFQNVFVP